MEPKIVTRNEKKVIGIEIRTSNQLEVHKSTARIPKAWQTFVTDNVLQRIPNKAHKTVVLGVYTQYESDHNGKYSLVIGTEVTSLDNIPEGMVGLTVVPSKYLEFNIKGQIPDVVVSSWQGIWKYFSEHKEYQRTYTTDFEVYDTDHPDKVDIFVAVE